MKSTFREKSECDELISYLRGNPKKIEEAKQFLLDWMSSDPSTVVNPEEGLMAIARNEKQELHKSDLYKEWMSRREEMFMRFWVERVMPHMSGPDLEKFFQTCGYIDLGEKFEEQCLKYLRNLE
tara:strand:+ start:2815 stop:3186 length:372 start_codon:yes stop_codon:yes gene_type:complete